MITLTTCKWIPDLPTLKAYRDRCMARPAYLRAMAAQMDGFSQAA